MTKTPKKRMVGRRRWAELVKFLTTTMKTSRSEKVRMTAALRLADVLTLREQREMAELRAQARKDAGLPPEVVASPVETAEDAQARMDAEAQERTRSVFDGLMKGKDVNVEPAA
jgi:hypothetical protein